MLVYGTANRILNGTRRDQGHLRLTSVESGHIELKSQIRFS
jgi:hypothetical protein